MRHDGSIAHLGRIGIAIVAAASLLLACGEEEATIEPTKPSKSSPAAEHEEAGEEPKAEAQKPAPRPQYSYSPIGKRDPFRSYLADLAESNQEQKKRKLEETEQYELDQFRLVGIIHGTAQPRALVEDPTGKGHTLRIGSRIGRNGGRVTRIYDTDEGSGIIVTEEFRDPTGARVRTPYRISLPKPEINLLEDL